MTDYNRYDDRQRYDRRNDDRNRYFEENDRYNSSDYNDEKYRQNMNQQRGSNYDTNSGYGNQNKNRPYKRYYPDYDQQGNRNYGGFGASDSGHNYGNTSNYNEEQERETHNYGSNYGGAYGTVGYFNSMDQQHADRPGTRNYDRDYNPSHGNNYNNAFERERRARWENDKRDWWDRAADEVASWFGDDDAERRRRRDKAVGPHKGKGPKNYKRSDDRIKDDINERLSDDTYIDASDIEVTVSNGVVVLSGTVESKHIKRRAEDIADTVSGVTNVENHLHVAKHTTHVGSSAVYSGNNKNK